MLIHFRLESGSFEKGFQISIQVYNNENQHIADINGRLPATHLIKGNYGNWKIDYMKVGKHFRLNIEEIDVPLIHFSELLQKCKNSSQDFIENFRQWLYAADFTPRLARILGREKAGKILIHIRADSINAEDVTLLKKMPWHELEIGGVPIGAESAFVHEVINPVPTAREITCVKILAILGNNIDIDIEGDRNTLEHLPNTQTTFLTEPERADVVHQLRDNHWDILFFAGHSTSQDGRGRIFINNKKEITENSLTIANLRNTLEVAVNNGLRLAIFNSCDGLKLAEDFAYLNIPQVIVMREPVPNMVAQEFLKYFLSEFSKGTELYLAVRYARDILEDNGWNEKVPGASWLPLIFQNPTAEPFKWPQAINIPQPVAQERVHIAVAQERVHIDNVPLITGYRQFGSIMNIEDAYFGLR